MRSITGNPFGKRTGYITRTIDALLKSMGGLTALYVKGFCYGLGLWMSAVVVWKLILE